MENQNLSIDPSKKFFDELKRKEQLLLEKQCSRVLAKIPGFPETREQFIANKPSGVSFYKWLNHPTNEFAFQDWVFKLLNFIKKTTELGWCCRYTLGEIAQQMEVSERRLRTTLNKLQQIGVIQSRHVRARRWLRILNTAFDD
jgi:hypothetical protein